MDTIDTTSTDLVISDADTYEVETPSFGKEVAKTLAISTGTSAAVFGTFFAITFAVPKVKAWYDRRKNPDVIEGTVVGDTTETVTAKKV